MQLHDFIPLGNLILGSFFILIGLGIHKPVIRKDREDLFNNAKPYFKILGVILILGGVAQIVMKFLF